MRNIVFKSALANKFINFVKLKQLGGYDYVSQSELLMYFDQFLLNRSFKQTFLTQAILHEYLNSINHLAPRGIANRYGVLRLFSIWLNQHNPSSYVLNKNIHRNGNHSRPAYIFSHEQIKTFLEKSKEICSKSEIISGLYQTIFSLLYTTGLRIKEALSLNCNDYYPIERCLHIREGKFKKERYIILSNSMNEKLKDYLNRYCFKFSPDESAPIFIGKSYRRLIYNSVQISFKRIIKAAEIHNKSSYEPRIHDLRHTFAVHCLLKWYKSEKDIYSKLPLLSTYMGHVKITSTQVYLHATKELLQKGSERFHLFFMNKIYNNH
jgi:site-specific recombinase XerD